MQLTFRAGKYIIISAKECGNSSMSKTKTPEVVETSGVFCSVYVRWLKPLGCYCLSFLSSHLQMK